MRRCLVVAVTVALALWLVGPSGTPAVPPTVSILNPRAGGIVSGSFKVQVQAWDAAAEVTAVSVSADGGGSYPTAAAKNTHYNPGAGSAIWEAVLSLAPGSYTLKARATSASGDGVSRAVVITVAPAGAGDGRLLVRDDSSTLCLDCHALATHSSQYTSTKYGNWAMVCRDCHTPHKTRNLGLIRETISTPQSGDRAVAFRISAGDAANSYVDSGAGGSTGGVCQVCHTQTQGAGGVARWRNTGNADAHYTAASGTQPCTKCHLHSAGFAPAGGGAHTTHVSGPQLSLACAECHNTASIPQFRDGATSKAATTVCDNCHSSTGVALAKQYWNTPGSSSGAAGSWAAVEGEKSYCGSCHDATPGNSRGDGTGDTAANVLGNDTTYGVYVTGHGKPSGSFARLAWQDTAATGNPAANRACGACHNLATPHFNHATKRLKAGYENDQNNSNCKQCHDPGTTAAANPQWYTTYAAYQASAHGAPAKGNLKCTACHEAHGSTGAYAGMTRGNREALCNNCHSGHAGHALQVSFNVAGNTYSLECASCHNVHLVTGLTSAANPSVSAITRFADNTAVWGASSGQKMSDYAGSGTYRTPNGDTLSGAQLPDYPTFCLDCHGQDMRPASIHGNISWGDLHGTSASNSPASGGGTCPDYTVCGLAEDWDGDDCVASDPNTCWPVKSRSLGDTKFTRPVYDHEERIANVNFVLSCSDCHATHVSGSGKLRSTVNGAAYTGEWKTLCNACHYYYSPDHGGMSCGAYNSCHNANVNPRPGYGLNGNTIHGMPAGGGGGGARTFNRDLVLDLRFENSFSDSGSYRLHGKWLDDTAGTFVLGRSGQGIQLTGGQTVQVGTTSSSWSTDEGAHGTWKYTEMKFNTTLEAWVYPTDDSSSEYSIFTKHVGINDGGYALALKKINGTLRVAFNMQADNNGVAQDGRAGIRGAYSSVAIPLNAWTHVGATFDTAGPDRNPGDPTVGRIRIYVNGEDVTTSDSSGSNMQPGPGETSIFAYAENSPWNQAVCYNGTWCASEFSVGGFPWQNRFVGKIDEAKVWNVTKDAAYFASYDAQTGPYIGSVEGLIGTTQLAVRFSEGVYGSGGSALGAADFTLVDTNGDNPRSITGVTHTAGASTATVTLSAALTAADVNADTLAAVANAVFDNYHNAAGTQAVPIGLSSQCPTSPVSIPLNEPSGSTFVMDTQNILYGAVYGGGATLTGGAYSGGGDGSGRYIQFEYNGTCLKASTALTIEARIKPTGLAGTGNYIRRILARDGSGNYQISVWRNNSWNSSSYAAPSGEASIALWVNPVDAHGGSAWKPVLTNYSGAQTGSENSCPIVSDHWYQIRAVWNTNKPGGIPGQFFQPADIYIEDQGTDGSGAGRNWEGFLNCTDSDQSLKPDASKFYTGDAINPADGSFAIGANRANPTNNLFNGLIDWIQVKDTAE